MTREEIEKTLRETMKIKVTVDLEDLIEDIGSVLTKEKPQKPTKASKNVFIGPVLIQCKNCTHKLFESWALEQPKHLPKYCSECGTRIDWSEYE